MVRVTKGIPNENDVEFVARSIQTLAKAYMNASFKEFNRNLEEFRAIYEPDYGEKDNVAHQ